ncbi:hypothetical protein MLD38_014402 [Melastoma candidum]|uniref:Uncharacterized protein n=1 Tax=Melastoma candidum TaxID=119954 RepID=A0ACB9RCR2_9MYRT|nr:hypothetical protein MLD38_014402 [Melastoma candidum]
MANSLCVAAACSIKNPPRITTLVGNTPVAGRVLTVKEGICSIGSSKFQSLEVKAASNTNPTAKKSSLFCSECDGNGIKECSQCKGTGVNTVDHFNGQFKAGGLCWLCRGKREILCGNCNGAGFVGGFLSTPDD